MTRLIWKLTEIMVLFFFQIKYTEGGENNLVMARSYFAQAAKLNPNNMRAQYGLLLVSCF